MHGPKIGKCLIQIIARIINDHFSAVREIAAKLVLVVQFIFPGPLFQKFVSLMRTIPVGPYVVGRTQHTIVEQPKSGR